MMEKVFILWHCVDLDDLEEDSKLIGVFSSRQKVTEAINTLKTKDGFVDYTVDHFIMDEYRIDEVNWAEGFCRV